MPREAPPKPGELRDGLVTYAGGKTVHYCVRWRGQLRKGDTKCTTRSAAKVWLEREKKRWAEQEHDREAPALRAILEKWLKIRGPEVSPGHKKEMENAVLVHASAFADRPATELNNLAANEIRSAYLQGEALGIRGTRTEGGANQLIKQLYALTGWAVETGMLEKRPFRLRKLDVTPKRKAVLWPEQVPAFLAAVDGGRHYKGRTYPHSATAARLMIILGLREDECRHAEWTQVDWRSSTFRIARGEAVENDPKDRGARAIPIPQPLLEHLAQVWKEQGEPTAGLVLPAEDGAPHRPQFTTKSIQRSGVELKIEGLTPHALRRTFATGHYEIGTPIGQIARMLGHADPETTLNHYIVQRDREQAAAQDGLAKAFGLSVPIGFTKSSKPNKNNK